MNYYHSNQWTRRVHRSTWFCDTDHEATQFNDLESFLEHMKEPDNHPGGEPPTAPQLDTLCRTQQKFIIRDDEYSCPFCDCIPDMLKRIVPNGDLTEILQQLHKHVAIHLKDFAILSIPILDATEAPEDVSDDSKPEEKRHWLRDSEEASNPSGYDQELRDIPLPSGDPEVRPPLDVKETPTTHWADTGFTRWYENEDESKSSERETDAILKAFVSKSTQSNRGVPLYGLLYADDRPVWPKEDPNRWFIELTPQDKKMFSPLDEVVTAEQYGEALGRPPPRAP
ncbi:hypothetical protein ACHAPE_002805 [Trichoderma viride]